MKQTHSHQEINKPLTAHQRLSLTSFSITLCLICLITPSFAQVVYCTGVPSPGNTLSSDASPCPGVDFTLSLQNVSVAVDITYQWQSADDSAFTVNVTNLGTASTQVTNEYAAQYYRCDVTCPSTPASTWSNPVYVPVAAYQTWYYDPDADGYYSLSESSCVYPGAGWTTDPHHGGGDCDDNDHTKWAYQLLYIDVDGDGFDNGTAIVCAGLEAPDGYWSNTFGPDCDDNNGAVNPNESEVCYNNIDDNCNGIIDENCCMNPTTLATTNITSSSVTLNWSAVESATKYKLQYKEAMGNSPWTVKKVSAGFTSTSITGLLASTKYKWKIQSICGSDQSAYSPVANFKTKALKEDDAYNGSLIEQNQFSIYPNPTAHSFIVDLNVKSDVNGEANIELLNELGQVIYTVRTEMTNGTIQFEVTPDENLAAGNYFVKVIANNEVYTERLMIQP